MNLKIVILGDASVGKSLLVAEKYHSDYMDTFGGELTVRKMIVDEQIVSVQVPFYDSMSIIISPLLRISTEVDTAYRIFVSISMIQTHAG